MKTPICLLNSGAFRADTVTHPGVLTQQTLDSIFPFRDDNAYIVKCTGAQLLEMLENSVSKYPDLDGRFLQVSGLEFEFDAAMEVYNRIVPGTVRVDIGDGGEFREVDMEKTYNVVVKGFIIRGNDGYTIVPENRQVAKSDGTIPEIITRWFENWMNNNNNEPRPVGGEIEGRITCLNTNVSLDLKYEE